MAYTSTRRNGTDTDIYLEFPLDPKTDRLLAECQGGGWEVLDWSPDGKQLLVAEGISISESYLWLVDTGHRREDRADPSRGGRGKSGLRPARSSPPTGGGFSSSPTRAASFNISRNRRLNDPTLYNLTPDLKHDVSSFDLSKNGQRLAVVTNEDGLSGLLVRTFGVDDMIATVLAIQDRTVQDGVVNTGGHGAWFDRLLPRQRGLRNEASANLPEGVISAVKWSGEENRGYSKMLGVSVGTARIPSDIFVSDDLNGAFQRWTVSETGGISPDAFVEPQLVKWPSFDQREISGFCTRPTQANFLASGRDHQHSRRPGGAIPAWISRAQQLPHQ